jgi:hypothetical protein
MYIMFFGLELFRLYFLYDALVSEGRNKFVNPPGYYYYSYLNVYLIKYFFSRFYGFKWLVKEVEQILGLIEYYY